MTHPDITIHHCAVMEQPSYDMSIHSNPDAQAWAKFFIKTQAETGFTIDEGLMISWFANAMMAMHDYLKQSKASTIEEIRGAVARGWCTPENSHKEMDTTLASAIADSVQASLQAQPKDSTKGDQDGQQLRPEIHSVGGQQPMEGAGVSTGSGFSGSRANLVACITALLSLDAAGALIPHGIGGHARTLLEAAAKALQAQPTPPAGQRKAFAWNAWQAAQVQAALEPVVNFEEAVDQYINDYEMNGEDANGTDCTYTPNEHEKALLKDAFMGFDFMGLDFTQSDSTPQPAPDYPAAAEPVAWEYENSHGMKFLTFENPLDFNGGAVYGYKEFTNFKPLGYTTPQPTPDAAEPVAAWENKYGMKEWQVHALRAGWSPQPTPDAEALHNGHNAKHWNLLAVQRYQENCALEHKLEDTAEAIRLALEALIVLRDYYTPDGVPGVVGNAIAALERVRP